MRTTILAVMAAAAVSAPVFGQSVRVWGSNGDGATVPSDLGPCIAVAAGHLHIVALRTDGIARAWGKNSGQCNVPSDLGPCT
ncbi:MAG: hypothetical protein ACKOTD_01890, partial [Phycisphaerales bacterium]